MIRAWVRDNPDICISVFYTDSDDQGRGWEAEQIRGGVKEERLPIIASLKRYGKLNCGLSKMVHEHDVVMIGGFEQASYLVAALLAKKANKPVILLFDGFSPRRFGREAKVVLALKRFTAHLAKGFFVNGTVGANYLREQVKIASDRPVYNQYLSHRDGPIEEARQMFAGLSKEEIQASLGIDAGGRRVLVACGYLIERKRLDLVIDAIAHLPAAERPLLLVVGSGGLEGALRTRAERANVPVHFAGFKLGRDLAAHYFAADALVLSSSDDPWGLVVNEAMSAGLPVLVSDACGVALDLVHDQVNGYTFRSGDAEELAEKLVLLLDSDLAAKGLASRKIIADWTPAHSARNLGTIVAEVMRRGRATIKGISK